LQLATHTATTKLEERTLKRVFVITERSLTGDLNVLTRCFCSRKMLSWFDVFLVTEKIMSQLQHLINRYISKGLSTCT